MNCETYLSMLSTLPVEELSYGDAREHAATCGDCDRVTRVVAERERNMLIAYGTMYSPVGTESVTARAIELSRRRRIVFFSKVGVVLAAAAALVLFVAIRRATPPLVRVVPAAPPPALAAAAVSLRCLSVEQAMELLQPMLSPAASLSTSRDAHLGILEISAPPAELARIRSTLDALDDSRATRCLLFEPGTPTGPPAR